MKSTFILLFMLLISANSPFALAAEPNQTETLSSGWLLTLNQNLTIPGQSAGVYLQYGRVVSEADKDQYYANCRLEVRDPLPQPQTVEADTFTVYRVKWTEDDVLLHSNQYASNRMIVSSSPTAADYATTLYLRSARQTNVTKLICQHWEDPTGFAEHLTLKQIRDTLGKIFTLQPGNK